MDLDNIALLLLFYSADKVYQGSGVEEEITRRKLTKKLSPKIPPTTGLGLHYHVTFCPLRTGGI